MRTIDKKSKHTKVEHASISELLILMVKLIRENKFDDVALLNSKYMKSIKEFNNINEMVEYINSTYCNSIIIKKRWARAFTEQLYFHQLSGFRLNEKSVTFVLNIGGNVIKKNIRFNSNDSLINKDINDKANNEAAFTDDFLGWLRR